MSEAQKLDELGKLTGSIAHDFNNLLTAINGYADLALVTLPDGNPVRSYLEEIRKAGSRACDLTMRLLAISYSPTAQVVAEVGKPPQAGQGVPPKPVVEPQETAPIILMAEDEEPVRNFVRLVLEGQGFAVLEAFNGEEALRLASRPDARIDLLLSDLVMPGMGGRELAIKVRTLRPSLRVVYMSGYTDDQVFRQGCMEPYATLLPKPFTAGALLERIRMALGQGEAVEQPVA